MASKRFIAQFVSGVLTANPPKWKISAPNLILLSGTGLRRMPDVLTWASKNYETTFVVPGPEEMVSDYGSICPRMDISTGPLRKIAAKFTNVRVLCRDTFDVSTDVRIVGLPWWPFMPPMYEQEYMRYISELRYTDIPHISDGIDMQNRLNSGDMHWLMCRIIDAKRENKKLIIATKYAPILHAIPETLYRMYPGRQHLICSHPKSLLTDEYSTCVKVWVFGVGPIAVSSIVEKTLVMNNPLGTPGTIPELMVQLA